MSKLLISITSKWRETSKWFPYVIWGLSEYKVTTETTKTSDRSSNKMLIKWRNFSNTLHENVETVIKFQHNLLVHALHGCRECFFKIMLCLVENHWYKLILAEWPRLRRTSFIIREGQNIFGSKVRWVVIVRPSCWKNSCWEHLISEGVP